MFKFFTILLPCFLIFCLTACSQQPKSTADIPRLLSNAHKITVAPFTQPVTPAQMITGQLPENQGLIPQNGLLNLDMRLREILLAKTKRNFNFLPTRQLPEGWFAPRSTAQPNALDKWLTFGQKHNLDYLLVPQALDWHEREGSEAGVTSSASVCVVFYLIDVPHQEVIARSIFEEKQVGLIDNLLTLPEFVQRKGQWVTAEDLAAEGMLQAIKDLGL